MSEHRASQKVVAVSPLHSYSTPGSISDSTPGSISAPIRFANEILTALTYNSGQVTH